MNCTFRFIAHCEKGRLAAAKQLLREAHALVTRLEKSLTEFQETSPVSKLNRALVNERISAPTELIELLNLSRLAEEVTGHAFQMLSKSVDDNPGIEWDEDSVWKLTSGTHLGFGAIGKGFALDKVRTLLFQEGFSDFYLTAGGSSLILEGFAGQNEPWTFGWSWDSVTGIPLAHRSGKTIAIGVSGLHEKGLHIRDTLKQRAARSALSALVATSSAALADAYSTALFVLGSEGFAKIPDAALGLIDEDGIPHWNSAFRNLWGDIPCQK
jgi:thiamine biosynthesis lipoprotein